LDILERHGLLGGIPASVRAHLARPRASGHHAHRGFPPRAEALLLADNSSLVEALDEAAARRGLAVHHHDLAMTGDAHAAARSFAAALRRRAAAKAPRPCLVVAAGETTLQVKGAGLGGRNQEFALVAAQELAEVAGVMLLASGTDGTDGPTSAAGAFADGSTCRRAAAAGRSVAQALADNDSHTLFRTIGDLHVTGPTGTNVMDLVLGLVL
jgi:glycerate-2-kinase